MWLLKRAQRGTAGPVLKAGEGLTGQVKQGASGSWSRQGNGFSTKAPKRQSTKAASRAKANTPASRKLLPVPFCSFNAKATGTAVTALWHCSRALFSNELELAVSEVRPRVPTAVAMVETRRSGARAERVQGRRKTRGLFMWFPPSVTRKRGDGGGICSHNSLGEYCVARVVG